MKGPKISIADDPSLKEGSPQLVLVEMSDFQCPYCGLGAREVIPQVHKDFVLTGKVEIVYLDFPLSMHSNAFLAAKAAACAGDQGKFWEMHNQLFANQEDLGPEELPGYAEALGLDTAAFGKCLSSGRHDAAIREDIRTAEGLGVTGTPAYALGRRLPDGKKIEILEVMKGLPSYEDLKEKINGFLSAQ